MSSLCISVLMYLWRTDTKVVEGAGDSVNNSNYDPMGSQTLRLVQQMLPIIVIQNSGLGHE